MCVCVRARACAFVWACMELVMRRLDIGTHQWCLKGDWISVRGGGRGKDSGRGRKTSVCAATCKSPPPHARLPPGLAVARSPSPGEMKDTELEKL